MLNISRTLKRVGGGGANIELNIVHNVVQKIVRNVVQDIVQNFVQDIIQNIVQNFPNRGNHNDDTLVARIQYYSETKRHRLGWCGIHWS